MTGTLIAMDDLSQEISPDLSTKEIAISNRGLYFITVQFLHKDGQWYGESGICIGRTLTDEYWDGCKVNAYVQGDSVKVEGLHLNPGQTLAFYGMLGSASYKILNADGSVAS